MWPFLILFSSGKINYRKKTPQKIKNITDEFQLANYIIMYKFYYVFEFGFII